MLETRGSRSGLSGEIEASGITAAVPARAAECSSDRGRVRDSTARDSGECKDRADAEQLCAKCVSQAEETRITPPYESNHDRAPITSHCRRPLIESGEGSPRREFAIEPDGSGFMRSEFRPSGIQVQRFESTHTLNDYHEVSTYGAGNITLWG